MGQDPILVMSHTKHLKSDIMSEQPDIDYVCNPGCKASDAIKQALTKHAGRLAWRHSSIILAGLLA